jgi:ABC-type dipeptide/oligopeptide/nickel transport system permease subunit
MTRTPDRLLTRAARIRAKAVREWLRRHMPPHLRVGLLHAVAYAVLLLSLAACVAPALLTRSSYQQQYREDIDAAPCARFPLGTDDLGRDRLARLVYGARTSLLLACAAALLSTAIATLVGGAAGWIGGGLEKVVLWGTDFFISLPWLFLLLTVRALLPLDVAPGASLAITFLLLGLLGWASPARVVRARVRSFVASDFVLQARACGSSGVRLFVRQVVPNMKPVLLAQFFVSLPLFVLSEANLGVLGLGVAEPLPSLGSLLRELQGYALLSSRPWAIIPAIVLTCVVASLHLAVSRSEAQS